MAGIEREQQLNEEIAATNEELASANEELVANLENLALVNTELVQSKDELLQLTDALEERVAARVADLESVQHRAGPRLHPQRGEFQSAARTVCRTETVDHRPGGRTRFAADGHGADPW